MNILREKWILLQIEIYICLWRLGFMGVLKFRGHRLSKVKVTERIVLENSKRWF